MEEVFKKMLKYESGTLLSLEDLNDYRKRFLYVLIHLLLNYTSAQNKDTYSTFFSFKAIRILT